MFVVCLRWLKITPCLWKLVFWNLLRCLVCEIMLNTLRGFEVDHSCFTPVSIVYTHNTRQSEINNFVVWRPRTRICVNFFKYLGHQLWSSVSEKLKRMSYFCRVSILGKFRMLFFSILCFMQMLLCLVGICHVFILVYALLVLCLLYTMFH